MRRRDRVRSPVWLAGFQWQGDQRNVAVTHGVALQPVSGSMDHLLKLGYLIECELDVGCYRVRCLPVRTNGGYRHASVALSYSGADLRSILASAALEGSKLRSTERDWDLSGTEVVRWVPS